MECAQTSCMTAAIAWEDELNCLPPGCERRAFMSSVGDYFVVAFKMLVYLEIRGRRVVLDERGTEVSTEDRKGFRDGMKHPYSKGTRPSLWKG